MFLGIDLGTSELKLLLLDEQHRVVATHGQPLTLQRPQPLWSEQHPQDWWTALDTGMQVLGAQRPQALAAVRAIGLAGQMHGAVLLDERGAVLRPAILWNDGRSGAQCQAMEAALPKLRALAGNAAMPGFTAPKLWWLREHESEVHARTATVLLPKDWLRWRLSGQCITDASDASGTLWLDVARRDWSVDLLAGCGLRAEQLPRVVEGSAAGGSLRGDWARRWGLRDGTLIAGGGGDNAASAVGTGAVAAGQGFVSLGTSGVIFVVGDRFSPNPARAVHAFCHALPGRWHQMSVMLSAASALRWAMQLLSAPDEATLLAQAEALGPKAWDRGPIFLPYLGGERTPHNDPGRTASLVGLTHEHGAGHVAQAVIEGVAFGLRDGWLALDARQRGRVQALSLVGGGARSGHWARVLASVLGVPLLRHAGGETGAALGAARLAWLAWQGAGGDEAAVCRPAPLLDVIEPDPELAEALLARHRRFESLQSMLRGA